MATQKSTSRLEARLPAHVHDMLKRAAEIEGRSLTDFVITAARDAAVRTIEQTAVLRVSAEDQKLIAEGLLNPPAPSRALQRAFRRHRELFGTL